MSYEMLNGKIIIISGAQGSGKTTTANVLSGALFNRFGRRPVQMKFAETIYLVHDYMRNLLRESGIEAPDKCREFMQWFGTDYGRKKYGDNLWVQITKNRISMELKMNPNSVIIIDDCRFENEFDFFPEALRIRLHAPQDVREKRTEAFGGASHRSETALDKYSDQDKFDLYLNTSEINPEGCVELILHKLTKGNWIEKRSLR